MAIFNNVVSESTEYVTIRARICGRIRKTGFIEFAE